MQYLTPLQNFLNNASKQPDKIFLNQPVDRRWRQFTWSEVENQARCIASGLVDQGFEKNSHIGILSKNCAEWLIADLAIMMAGMITVPIYPTADHNTIEYVIQHAKLKAIFLGKLDSSAAAEQTVNENILSIAMPYFTAASQIQLTDWLNRYPPLKEIHNASIDDMATIIYTSGSTGQPKGVVLTHKNWASAAYYSTELFSMTNTDRYVSYLPLAHVTERSAEAMIYQSGCEVFFTESIETFIDDVRYAKPTLFGTVPRLWIKFQTQILNIISEKKLSLLLSIPVLGKMIAKKIRGSLGLQHADRFFSGTAPIATSLLIWYHRLGISICEGWGMSETSSLSCMNIPFSKQLIGTIGKPIKCLKMKLSEQGEILVKGDSVFSEYYLEPEITANSFSDGWFCTGDIGEVDDNGVFKIVGRLKDNFKTSKGKYVTPVPIESALLTNTAIEQVCVVGSGLKQPVALIVLTKESNQNNPVTIQSLINTLAHVNNNLEKHQKLDYFFICNDAWTIDNDLLTPTMKIKRNLIEEKYQQYIAHETSEKIVWEKEISE